MVKVLEKALSKSRSPAMNFYRAKYLHRLDEPDLEFESKVQIFNVDDNTLKITPRRMADQENQQRNS